jgi:hypothetical protein
LVNTDSTAPPAAAIKTFVLRGWGVSMDKRLGQRATGPVPVIRQDRAAVRGDQDCLRQPGGFLA